MVSKLGFEAFNACASFSFLATKYNEPNIITSGNKDCFMLTLLFLFHPRFLIFTFIFSYSIRQLESQQRKLSEMKDALMEQKNETQEKITEDIKRLSLSTETVKIHISFS